MSWHRGSDDVGLNSCYANLVFDGDESILLRDQEEVEILPFAVGLGLLQSQISRSIKESGSSRSLRVIRTFAEESRHKSSLRPWRGSRMKARKIEWRRLRRSKPRALKD